MRRVPGVLVAAVALVAAAVGVWRLSLDPSVETGRLVREGQDAASARDALGVERTLARLTGRDPDAAALVAGEAAHFAGDSVRALAELGRVPAGSPWRARAVLIAGYAALRADPPMLARACLEEALETLPDEADAHRALSAIAYDLGQTPVALRHLAEVARLDPADGRPWRQTGLIHRDLDRPADAVPAYTEALKRRLNPLVAREVRLESAECLVRLNRPDEARATLGPPPTEPPETPAEAAARLAVAAQLDAPEAFARAAEDAGRRFPDSPAILRLRARARSDAGAPAEAVALLERAASLEPGEIRHLYDLAQARQRAGDDRGAARAEAELRRVQGLINRLAEASIDAANAPWDAGIRREMARLCRELGRPALAARWERAAEACEALRAERPAT